METALVAHFINNQIQIFTFFSFLGLGVIILIGVLVDCCVRSTKEEYEYEKKEFVDVNKTQR